MISTMPRGCRLPNNRPPLLPHMQRQVGHAVHAPVVNVANRMEVAPPFLIEHASILEKVAIGALIVGQGIFALFDPLSLTDQCIVGGFIIYSAFKKASAKFNAVIQIEPRQNIETRINQLSLVAALTGIALGMLLDLSLQRGIPGVKGAIIGFLFGMIALKKGSSLEPVRANNLPGRGRDLSKQIFQSLLKPLCRYSHKEAVVKILFLSYFTFQIGQLWKQKQESTLSNPLVDVVRVHISHSLKAIALAPLSIEVWKRTQKFLAWL